MRFLSLAGLLLLASGSLLAGEKKLMHCFAFTTIDGASDADWKAFAAATDALPGKVAGVSKVWHGKLRGPLSIFGADAESRKKLMAGEAKVQGDITRTTRQYGVCMEMADEAALKAYAADPAHKEWGEAYAKVRVAGTTTIDILGQ